MKQEVKAARIKIENMLVLEILCSVQQELMQAFEESISIYQQFNIYFKDIVNNLIKIAFLYNKTKTRSTFKATPMDESFNLIPI